MKYGTNGTPGIAVYKNVLFAVHEGYQAAFGSTSSGQHEATGLIWYTGFKDNKWESPKDTNTGYGTTGTPALAIYDDKLYCVHLAKGGKPNQLWWACYNGEKWTTSDTLLGNQRAASTPSLGVYNPT